MAIHTDIALMATHAWAQANAGKADHEQGPERFAERVALVFVQTLGALEREHPAPMAAEVLAPDGLSPASLALPKGAEEQGPA